MLKHAGAAASYQKAELGIEQEAEALLELLREVLGCLRTGVGKQRAYRRG